MAIEESVNNLWPLLENKNEDKQNMSLHKITPWTSKTTVCRGATFSSLPGMAKLSHIV